MKKLSDKEWKAFSVSDLFSIQLARGDNQLASAECGQTPLVSAGTKSNGVIGFITNGDDGSLFTGDYITVDMFGQTFYQPFSFYAVSHGRLNMLSNDDIPASAKSFIAVCTNVQNKDKYSYNQMCSSKRLARQKLMLPVNDDGEPDYNYMEEYTRQTREALLARYREYLENRISDLGEEVVIPALNEKTWKSFRAGDLFDIYTGGDMIVSRLAYGNIPLISHSEQNNGVVKYIKKQQDIKLFDCNKTLSLADRGNFCANIQSKNFYVGTRVKALVFKDKIKNPRNILKFISICINKQSVKFNYGNNCTGSVASLLIMLPVTDDGNPDYEYMEQYAKNVMHRKYKQYMAFLEKKSQKQTNI